MYIDARIDVIRVLLDIIVMVRITKQGPSNNNMMVPHSHCWCGNNRWNRLLLVIFAFLLGMVVTTLEAFPDLKQLLQSNNDSTNQDNRIKTKTNNDKEGLKFLLGQDEEDHSNILLGNDGDNTKAVTKQPNHQRDGTNKYKSASCNYECQTDRLGHEMPLYPGQALCYQQQRFGLTTSGDFVIHDCETNEKKVFWSASKVSSSMHFEMKKDGRFQIILSKQQEDEVLFEHKPKRIVSYSKECLSKPKLDCPYLHLRKNGMVVLNWEDKVTGEWMDRDMQRIYPNLYP